MTETAEHATGLTRGSQPPTSSEIGDLFVATRDDLYSYLAYLTGDRLLAEDLAATAFERALKKRRLFERSRGDLRGWIFGIARNAALDALRAGGRECALELLPEVADAGDSVAASDERIALTAAMRRLRPADRELIALKFFAGLENPEIARTLKISKSNAGTQLHRAIGRLREELEGEGHV